MAKKKLDSLKGILSENPMEWILLFIILFLSHLIFMYADIIDTIENSLIFIRAVYQGQILDFYDLSAQQSRANYAANYNLLVYIIFGIWNLPGYIIAHFLGKDFISWAPTLVWSKTLLLIFTIMVSYLIYKICVCLTPPMRKIIILVYQ